MLTVLFLGDIVGQPGRAAVIARLPDLKAKYALDFVIVNGENAAGGRGITGKITIDLLRAGVSVITSGDHIWDQKEILSFIDTEPRLLRPVNYPDGAPGSGSIVLETAKGKIGVINVQARTFMQPILDNPFRAVEAVVTKMRSETPNIIVDAHGETTSEKIAPGPVSRWQSVRGHRHPYSRSDSRRADLPRRHGFLVRRRNVRTCKFHPGTHRGPDHHSVYLESALILSGSRRRSTLARRPRSN